MVRRATAAVGFGLVVACGAGGTSGVEVSEAIWTDGRWPLTVASGRLFSSVQFYVTADT